MPEPVKGGISVLFRIYDSGRHLYRSTEEVKTLSVQAVLPAGDSLSENTVKELTELLFLHGKDIRYAASIELKEDEQSAIGGITIPFHKGAAAYYAECGIEVPTE